MDFIFLVGKFIAAAIVAVVVIFLLAVLGIRFWLGRVLKQAMNAPHLNPARVKLTAYHGETAHPAEMAQLIEEARQLGYELIEPNHLFESDSIHGIFIYFLQNSTKTTHIAIYDSENLKAPMIDVIQCYADKTVRGVSNSSFPALPYPSNVQNIKLPKASTLTELLEYKTQAFTTEGLFAVEGKKLSSILEQLYAIQQDYLIHLNFADIDYVKAQIDVSDEKHIYEKQSPAEQQKTIQLIQNTMRENYEYNIPIVVTERFLKETKMDALEWQQYEENLVIIHERQTAEQLWDDHFQNCFIDYVHDEQSDEWIEKPIANSAVMDQLEVLKTQYMHRPLDYTNAVLNLLPSTVSVKKIGEVRYPLHAVLYCFE